MKLCKSKNVRKTNVTVIVIILLFELCFMPAQVQAQWGARSQRLGNSAKVGSWTNAEGIWGYCPESGSGLRITSYQGTAKDIAIPAKINGMPVHSIGRRAFAGTYVEMIRISEGVFALEKDAFRACKSLHGVTLPKSLTKHCVDSSAFQYCQNLKFLIIPETLKGVFIIPKQAKALYYKNDPGEIDSSAFVEESTKEKDISDTDSRVNFKDECIRRVTFDPNRESTVGRYHYGVEGSGTMKPIPFNMSDTIKLPPNKFTCRVRKSRAGDFYPEEYSFEGWATNKADKVVFLDCSEVKLDGDTILYAKWSPYRYIRFNANGGEGSMPSVHFKKGATVKLPQNKYNKRPGRRYGKPDEEISCIFAGWSTNENGEVVYADESEATFEMDGDVTLYAKWIEACEVHFMSNFSGFGSGGEEMQPMKMPANESFALATNTYEREGYEFTGWALTPDGESEFADGATVSFGGGPVKLYAKWEDHDQVTLHADDSIKYSQQKDDNQTASAGLLPNELQIGKVSDIEANPVVSEFDVANQNETYSVPDEILYNEDRTKLVRCPEGRTEKVIIPSSTKVIATSAFARCAKLKEIVFSEGLEVIEHDAFARCGVEKIALPNSLTNIGYGAFANCSNLSSVTIPENVRFIQNEAFRNCTSLSEISLPDHLEDIGMEAFSGCSSLSLTCLPPEVRDVGQKAFANCSSLEGVKFLGKIRVVESRAFEGCVNLKSLEFNNNEEVKLRYQNCTKLESLSFLGRGGVDLDFDESPFSGCTNQRKSITVNMDCPMIRGRWSEFGKGICFRIIADKRVLEIPEFDFSRLRTMKIDLHDDGWSQIKNRIPYCSSGEELVAKFPANGFCDSHPPLYKEFCAGADYEWCSHRFAELRQKGQILRKDDVSSYSGERCHNISQNVNVLCLLFDNDLAILKGVEIFFSPPGVSLEALEEKYHKSAKGKFWIKRRTLEKDGDSKAVYLATRKFGGNGSGYELEEIMLGDDEICVRMEVLDSWGNYRLGPWIEMRRHDGYISTPDAIKYIVVRSRKLDAALAERDRKEKAAKKKAEEEAAAKKESDALDF